MSNCCIYFKSGITAQHCFYTPDPQCVEKLPYACATTTVEQRGFIWTLLSTSVPVTEDGVYLRRDVAGEALAYTRSSHLSAFHIPSWKIHTRIWMHTVTRWETHSNTCTCNTLQLCFGWCWRADGKTQLTPNRAGMTELEFYNQPYWFTHYLLHRRSPCRGSKATALFYSILLYCTVSCSEKD